MFEKAERGIEVTDKINVEISVNNFKTIAKDFGAQEIDNFLASSNFSKEFRLEDGKIKTVKEIWDRIEQERDDQSFLLV